MIFKSLDFHGAYVVRPEPIVDDRGSITRVLYSDEFGNQGLAERWVQSGISTSKKGVVRGFHRQRGQDKFYFVIRGGIQDVLLSKVMDRPFESTTIYLKPGMGIYIPDGLFHGFQSLETDTCLLYYTSTFHYPEFEERIRYDCVKWALPVTQVSEKDKQK